MVKKNAMKITPSQLFTILSVAIHEMKKHEDDYKNTLPAAKECLTWVWKISWDETNSKCIEINEC